MPTSGAKGIVAALALTVFVQGCGEGNPFNVGRGAFSLGCSIPSDQIYAGAARDAIPAIDIPEITHASAADFMEDRDRVLGVVVNGAARAYPLFILWWHEVANDTLGGERIVVSYCPLTGSGLAFDAVVDGRWRLFGVSGLLYENNLIMFDRQTESLWNQMLMGAQCGPERGKGLTRIPVVETTWGDWRWLYRETTVMTTNTGYSRSYGAYPYGNYDDPNNSSLLYPLSKYSRARPPKELVLGVREGTAHAAAYPFGALREQGQAVALNEVVGERPVLVTYFDPARTARAFDRWVNGQTLTFEAGADTTALTLVDAETGSTWDATGLATAGPLAGARLAPLADAWTVFWFAWSIFYPGTTLFAR